MGGVSALCKGKRGTSHSKWVPVLLHKIDSMKKPPSQTPVCGQTSLTCGPSAAHPPGSPSPAAPAAGGWSRAPRLTSRCAASPGRPPAWPGFHGSACRQCGSPCCWPRERKAEGKMKTQREHSALCPHPPHRCMLVRRWQAGLARKGDQCPAERWWLIPPLCPLR